MSTNRISSHYSQMLAAVRAWLENDHPEAQYATVVVEIGDDLPALTVPVIHRDELASVPQ